MKRLPPKPSLFPYTTLFRSVVLTKAPTGNVTIDLAVAGNDVRIVGSSQLIFTPANWFTPQAVTVRALDDFDREATHFDRITHAIAPTTMDAFLGVTLQDVIGGLAREINEDLAQQRSAAVAYTHADVELVGVQRVGDVWTVTVNGVRLDAYVVKASDDLADVAAALAELIDDLGGISATATDESIEV